MEKVTLHLELITANNPEAEPLLWLEESVFSNRKIIHETYQGDSPEIETMVDWIYSILSNRSLYIFHIREFSLYYKNDYITIPVKSFFPLVVDFRNSHSDFRTYFHNGLSFAFLPKAIREHYTAVFPEEYPGIPLNKVNFNSIYRILPEKVRGAVADVGLLHYILTEVKGLSLKDADTLVATWKLYQQGIEYAQAEELDMLLEDYTVVSDDNLEYLMLPKEDIENETH